MDSYKVRCRVHPDMPARLPSMELCSACEQRLMAAERRLHAGEPLTSVQRETIQGLGRLWPAAVQERYSRDCLRAAAAAHTEHVGRDKRRGKAAYAARLVGGLTWTRIADRLGYRSSQAAITAARRYARQRDLPWPPPKGSLDANPRGEE